MHETLVTRFIRTAAIAVILACMAWGRAAAQTEPEAPTEPQPLRNGWQISFYTGVSYNHFYGYYDGLRDDCNCTFVGNGNSFNVPFGFALNVPLFNDASLYLRAGFSKSSTNFFDGRIDSLVSTNDVGDVGDDLNLRYDLVQFDILLRLIGRLNGERVYFGVGFNSVRRQDVLLTETEYLTNTRYLIRNGPIEGGKSWLPAFVIGAEYALVPTRNLFLIPAFELEYSLTKISDVQPLRPNLYRLLLNISYQVF